MTRLLLFILVLAGGLFYFYYRSEQDPQKRRGLLRQGLLYGVAALLLVAVLSGRLHWIGAALAALLGLIRPILGLMLRFFPALAPTLLAAWKNSSSGSGSNTGARPQQSSVSTDYLEMTLNHDTGDLQGEVRQGEFAGRMLADLSAEQLAALLEYLSAHDANSVSLLESYLQQRFGDEYESGSSGDKAKPPPAASPEMSREQALAILGLDDLDHEPTQEEVKFAHKRLMQKLHPDAGGNDYLASQINMARDKLLKQ